MQQHFDVIIIGSGLVGLMLASLLAEQELKVAIVDAGDIKLTQLKQDQYQLRVSAINLAGEKLLRQLGVWYDIVDGGRVSAFEKMVVWDSLGRGQIEFDCTEIATSQLGYIIENAVIHNALLKLLQQFPQVTYFAHNKPTALAIQHNAIEVKFTPQQSITAQLIVGADGGNSWIRANSHIDCYEWSYYHEALVTTVATEKSHQKTAWQCFLSEGPLALLPLADPHQCSIVWSANIAAMNRLSQLKEEDFNVELTNAFEYRLGKIRKISHQVIFPLMMRHAKSYINNRIALVGDAAHTIHPLAGQGVNLGFADAYSLADKIQLAKKQTGDCGNYRWLRRYERSRKGDNWSMIIGMEFFKRLFENESMLLTKLRSLGLTVVNKNQWLKNQFTAKALGE